MGKRESNIRTMRSDVSEFLKTTKPSLVSLLTKQVEASQPTADGDRMRWFSARLVVIAGALALIAAAGVIAWLQFSHRPAPIAEETLTPPDPYIFYDLVRDTTIAETKQDLRRVFQQMRDTPRPIGSFHRFIIRIKNADGAAVSVDAKEFFAILGVTPPLGLIENISGLPQFFVYQESSGPHFGIIYEVRNPARALQALFSWEPSMQASLEDFFFGAPPPASLKPYQDMTYRNIDFRYLKLDDSRDLGLGYFAFPAKRLIVITTSEEAIHLAITRLFVGR